ncbi:MAG: polyprenol phosphomannose-dependent alpha 1,6 mannosyltransferase MptB [Solirubrobacterales bacterium]
MLGVFGTGTGIGPGAYLALMIAAFAAYLCAIAGSGELAPRLFWGVLVALLVAFALAPPLLSADVFSYVSYARLGVLHGLDPYSHAPAEVPADPVFGLVGWRGSTSAYGPLFTGLSYPTAWLGPAAALWSLKAAAAASVLGTALLTARLAASRGIEPRPAAALVALNPLVLVHVVGGGHNDALAVLLSTAGMAAVLGGAERAGGAGLAAAAAVKASSLLVVPFAVLGAGRWRRVAAGALGAGLALALAGLIAFGPASLRIAGLSGENQGHVAHRSVPYLAASLTGAGLGPVRAAALALYALALAGLLAWVLRGADWVRAAGWALLGLLLASAWVLPWYLLWALPAAALSRDRALRAAVLGLTALHLATRVPL